MTWKTNIKHAIPPKVLNYTLLALPFLYRTNLVDYESNLRSGGGIDDLLAQIDLVVPIPGDLAECGCSRCGTTVIVAEYLRAKKAQKLIYAYDSFEGFDLSELHKERSAGLTDSPDDSFSSTSLDYVQTKFKKLGVSDLIVPVKGYFQDTLPHSQANFCLAFIDCDLQDSLVYCAETLWPRISKGGRLLFDDYTSKLYLGAQIGVNAFVNKYQDEIQEHGLLKRLYYVVKQ